VGRPESPHRPQVISARDLPDTTRRLAASRHRAAPLMLASIPGFQPGQVRQHPAPVMGQQPVRGQSPRQPASSSPCQPGGCEHASSADASDSIPTTRLTAIARLPPPPCGAAGSMIAAMTSHAIRGGDRAAPGRAGEHEPGITVQGEALKMPAQVGRDHIGERHQADARVRLGRPEGSSAANGLGELPSTRTVQASRSISPRRSAASSPQRKLPKVPSSTSAR
jgi:hypothetical protein